MEDPAPPEVSIFDPDVKQKVKTAMKIAFVSEFIIGAMMVICCNVLYCYAWNATPITKVGRKSFHALTPFTFSTWISKI